ncbi:CDK2-associated and cullin domain-containing protein 1 isoform X4 [Myotis daubentonii]|uniref:CDK2-associated and cullin domain-containing protein 1 isoform X4 n=1 Tax=Myotis daubentonii TaxID=98922 RepID=UPI002873547D|nr:CDK2-associated and cullin domain-containing protein 1 isoform X4 [Myotis daubentonii]
MEESMEEEEGGSYEAMMDDQNHNNWEAAVDGFRQPPPPPSSIPAPAREPPGGQLLVVPAVSADRKGPKEGLPLGPPPPEANGVIMMVKSCDAAAAKAVPAPTPSSTININTSTSKFLMNVITIEDYKSTYWPKLDGAIDQLLTQSPGDYIPISYEQIYSCVYKCVCQQHSEQMYSDLIKKITNHLERVSKELQASPPDVYIERFNIALGQYMGALQSIVPLFIYMNKFYIETKLNRDLKDDLIKLFTEHVAEKHIYSLMPLLLEAQSTPFQVTPSTMANIVKGLYTLRPEVTSPGRELGMSWLITAPQHVRVPEGTDSDCVECTFLPATRTHWSCRDFSEHSGSCTQALSHGCSQKRMSDFLL